MPPGISPFNPQAPWKNCHENFTHTFTPGASYTLDHKGNNLSQKDAYRRATANLQWAIGQAMQKGTTLRALGGNWSFSKVAVCNGGIVQTKALDLIFNPGAHHLAPAYTTKGKTHRDLRLVECGTQIARLNRALEIETDPPRCIRASGGSNGQTIAGATATGTHGAALFTGAVHDAVVGLHIVTGPDTHVWLERESYPVASQELIDWLGATPIRSDEMFNAAIVSFGSFGIIHGMMLETEPLFLLKEYRISNVKFTDALMNAFATLDIAALRTHLPGMPESKQGHELYHMEINLNPYAVHKGGTEGMYVFFFYKVPVPAGYVVEHSGPTDAAPSPEFVWIMKSLLSALGDDLSYNHIKKATTKEFEKNVRPATPEPRTIGSIFRDTRFTGNIASFALAIATNSLPAAIDQILVEIGEHAFAGAVAVRFVKGTNATLGFTRFPATCVIEMDGLDSPANRKVFAAVISRLETVGIPHTIHWGKLNDPLTAERIKKMYGTTKLQSWKSAREKLLSPQVRKVFTNDFMIKCDLHTPASSPIV
jgi:hypothetical protein